MSFRATLLDEINRTGLSDDELASNLKVSKFTIQRWKDGKSKPHELGRLSVFKVLEKVNDCR